ncbi:MAG: acyl-CoA dehydrogenase family protein [Hyphomonadaceae bacterium]
MDASDDAFLADVRAFLDCALTPDLREAGRATLGVHSEIGACRVWHRRLFERGWIAPAWPTHWGGVNWTARQRFLFERECALNDAPILFAGGLRSLGPLLMEMGNPEQQRRYLPSILSGDDLWCQGFSEPNAGSDLSAIETRAVRDGAFYVLNGSKIWTTGAHIANRMFAIVRTHKGDRKQEGVTFLLIDMTSPGIRISPILDLTGAHEFNQVFFEDVLVSTAERVGGENDGWSVAKRLMQLARSNNTPSALVCRALRRAALLAANAGLSEDPAISAKLAMLEIELEAFACLELATLSSGRPAPGATVAPSMLKLIGTELHQRVTALMLEIAAPHGAALHCSGDDTPAAFTAAKYFAVRAATIYSGASETQRNIIARHLLE